MPSLEDILPHKTFNYFLSSDAAWKCLRNKLPVREYTPPDLPFGRLHGSYLMLEGVSRAFYHAICNGRRHRRSDRTFKSLDSDELRDLYEHSWNDKEFRDLAEIREENAFKRRVRQRTTPYPSPLTQPAFYCSYCEQETSKKCQHGKCPDCCGDACTCPNGVTPHPQSCWNCDRYLPLCATWYCYDCCQWLNCDCMCCPEIELPDYDVEDPKTPSYSPPNTP